MSDTDKRRPGQLEVWWHEQGPRGGDNPKAMEVSGVMGARSVSRALLREPDRYHAVKVMRWNGHKWELVKRP